MPAIHPTGKKGIRGRGDVWQIVEYVHDLPKDAKHLHGKLLPYLLLVKVSIHIFSNGGGRGS